jgi:hypothetical protein
MPVTAFAISSEFGGPPGNSGGFGSATNPAGVMAQLALQQTALQVQQANNFCVGKVPAGTVPTDWRGTLTLKGPGKSEVLVILCADGIPFWQGEFDTDNKTTTWLISGPIPKEWGPIGEVGWIYDLINYTSTMASPVEIQITVQCVPG